MCVSVLRGRTPEAVLVQVGPKALEVILEALQQRQILPGPLVQQAPKEPQEPRPVEVVQAWLGQEPLLCRLPLSSTQLRRLLHCQRLQARWLRLASAAMRIGWA